MALGKVPVIREQFNVSHIRVYELLLNQDIPTELPLPHEFFQLAKKSNMLPTEISNNKIYKSVGS